MRTKSLLENGEQSPQPSLSAGDGHRCVLFWVKWLRQEKWEIWIARLVAPVEAPWVIERCAADATSVSLQSGGIGEARSSCPLKRDG